MVREHSKKLCLGKRSLLARNITGKNDDLCYRSLDEPTETKKKLEQIASIRQIIQGKRLSRLDLVTVVTQQNF